MNPAPRYRHLRHELARRHDNLAHWVAVHLPRSVAYWAFIRVAVHGIDNYPGDRRVVEALDTWPYPPLRAVRAEPPAACTCPDPEIAARSGHVVRCLLRAPTTGRDPAPLRRVR